MTDLQTLAALMLSSRITRGRGVQYGLPATQGQLDLAKKLGLDVGPRPLLYPTACRITARLAGKIIRTILPDVQAVAA